MTESEIHKAVVNHLRYRGVPGLVWWHTPNGGYRSPWAAAEFKRAGVLPGVADLILLHEGRNHALELKTERGEPTKAQLKFIQNVCANGWKAAICRGLDPALDKLREWGLIQ